MMYYVAIFALLLQYITERYTLAMFYRLPTKFAIQLPLVNLAILSFAPIVLMLTNFWMFGNKQMFGS